MISDIIKELRKLEFFTNGGARFECTDYERMEQELVAFLTKALNRVLDDIDVEEIEVKGQVLDRATFGYNQKTKELKDFITNYRK